MEKPISKPLIIILCLIILFSAAFSFREYGRLQKLHIIAAYKEAMTQKIAQNHGVLTDKNIDLISSWMTFDYINKIFNLPQDYLKDALVISDPHYPRIPISIYARIHGVSSAEFLLQVQQAVAAYFH